MFAQQILPCFSFCPVYREVRINFRNQNKNSFGGRSSINRRFPRTNGLFRLEILILAFGNGRTCTWTSRTIDRDANQIRISRLLIHRATRVLDTSVARNSRKKLSVDGRVCTNNSKSSEQSTNTLHAFNMHEADCTCIYYMSRHKIRSPFQDFETHVRSYRSLRVENTETTFLVYFPLRNSDSPKGVDSFSRCSNIPIVEMAWNTVHSPESSL